MKSVFNRLLTIKQGLPKNFVFNVSIYKTSSEYTRFTRRKWAHPGERNFPCWAQPTSKYILSILVVKHSQISFRSFCYHVNKSWSFSRDRISSIQRLIVTIANLDHSQSWLKYCTNRLIMASSRKNNLLTDVQRSILSRYFDQGMTGKGQAHNDLIEQASAEAKVTKETVKVRLYWLKCFYRFHIFMLDSSVNMECCLDPFLSSRW